MLLTCKDTADLPAVVRMWFLVDHFVCIHIRFASYLLYHVWDLHIRIIWIYFHMGVWARWSEILLTISFLNHLRPWCWILVGLRFGFDLLQWHWFTNDISVVLTFVKWSFDHPLILLTTIASIPMKRVTILVTELVKARFLSTWCNFSS